MEDEIIMTGKSDRGNVKRSDPLDEDRRKYLKTVGALVAGLAVGGAAGWLSKPAERVEVPGVTVTEPGATVTKTVEKTISPTPVKKTELKFMQWVVPEIPYFNDAIAVYEAAHPDIKIVLDTYPWGGGSDWHDKMITSLKGGTLGDVIVVSPSGMAIPEAADIGLSPCLEEFLKGKELEDFLDQYLTGALEMVKWKDKFWGLPWRYGVSCVYVNMKVLREAGVTIPRDWTWDDFVEVAKACTDPSIDRYGFAPIVSTHDPAGTTWTWYAFLFAAGGRLEPIDGRCAFNTPEGVESLEFLVNLLREEKVVSPGATAWSMKEVMDAFAVGKAAMWHNGPWWITVMAERYPDLEFATYMMPKGPAGTGSVASGTNMVVSTQTKHPKESWEFMKYLCGYDVQKTMSKVAYYMPCLKELLKEPIFKVPPMAAFTEQAAGPNVGFYGTGLPEYFTLQDTLTSEIQAAFLGRKTPAEALADAEAGWNEVLKKYYG